MKEGGLDEDVTLERVRAYQVIFCTVEAWPTSLPCSLLPKGGPRERVLYGDGKRAWNLIIFVGLEVKRIPIMSRGLTSE